MIAWLGPSSSTAHSNHAFVCRRPWCDNVLTYISRPNFVSVLESADTTDTGIYDNPVYEMREEKQLHWPMDYWSDCVHLVRYVRIQFFTQNICAANTIVRCTAACQQNCVRTATRKRIILIVIYLAFPKDNGYHLLVATAKQTNC